MAQSLELRTIFADSTWATRNDDGSFSINLSEQMEVAPEHVLFLDNISVCGNLPQISLHNRNLYVMERVPKRFEYANVQIKAGGNTTPIQPTSLNTGHPDLAQYRFHTELSATGPLVLWYPDDTECTFVGRLWIGKTYATFNASDPFEEVSGKYMYTTGIVHWSPRMPNQYATWELQSFPALETLDTLRVLQVPIGDYTAQAMREELQRLLQDGAFQGRIPEGSGTQYLVEGSGNEIRVRTNETLVRADEFYILPDSFLKKRGNARLFSTAWSADQPRSINSVLGNTEERNLNNVFGTGNVSMAGYWTAPQSHPTRTHLDGTWLAGTVTVTIRRDIDFGEYEVLSPAGVHLRFFSVDNANALLSEEYMLAAQDWSDGPNDIAIYSQRSTPVSVRLGGTWTRVDANGTTISPVTMTWQTAHGWYHFTDAVTDSPSLTNAAGNWTDQAGATQAVTATADPFLFNNPGGTMRFGKIDGTHIHFIFTQTGTGSTLMFLENGAGVFVDQAGLGLSLTPPAGFAWAGLLHADGTLTPGTATDLSTPLTLVTSAGTSTLTLTAPSSIAFPHGQILTASGFQASGRFQYLATAVVAGTNPPHPEPYWRFNIYGAQVIGDKENGVVSTNGTGTITWETSAAWTRPGALPLFTGTWNNASLAWNDATWTLQQLEQATIVQQLTASYSSDALSWYQEGILQAGQFHVNGTKLMAGPPGVSPDIVAANYNESTGELTFTDGSLVWTRRGSIPRMPAQQFTYQPGHSNSVLYLMMEGGATGLNTRGPGYHSSTVAKLQLNPESPVSHTETMRAHRYVEIPPGVLSQVTFFVRTADGAVVDLTALGASISFVLTISTRDGG